MIELAENNIVEEAVKNLLSFIEEEEAEEFESNKEDYIVDTPEKANYEARKVKRLRLEMSANSAAAKKAIETFTAKVLAWEEKENSPLQYQEQRSVAMLESFAKTKLAGSNKKSMKLIDGTFAFKTPAAKFEYNDEELLTFLQAASPQYLKPGALTIDKAGLKKDGEVKNGKFFLKGSEVASIKIVPQDTQFDVK